MDAGRDSSVSWCRGLCHESLWRKTYMGHNKGSRKRSGLCKYYPSKCELRTNLQLVDQRCYYRVWGRDLLHQTGSPLAISAGLLPSTLWLFRLEHCQSYHHLLSLLRDHDSCQDLSMHTKVQDLQQDPSGPLPQYLRCPQCQRTIQYHHRFFRSLPSDQGSMGIEIGKKEKDHRGHGLHLWPLVCLRKDSKQLPDC